MGPPIAPANQALLFDEVVGGGVCEVGCDVLELDGVALGDVVPVLDDVGRADVVPMVTISRKALNLIKLINLLLDRTTAVLDAFTKPLILNPGDEICCVYGSEESKKVKRKTNQSWPENASEAIPTVQSQDTVVVTSRPPKCRVSPQGIAEHDGEVHSRAILAL